MESRARGATAVAGGGDRAGPVNGGALTGLPLDPLADRYELEELIGSGGMASVYRGFDRKLERRVAVKLLHAPLSSDSDIVARFRREASAVAKLNHPNIVSVIDRGEVDGRQYIVLEFVAGESLKQLLAHGPRPGIRRSLELAIECGRGLAYAHGQGVVHRDVKPENILIGPAAAKVTDFGIAYVTGFDELTLTGTVLGTSYYVAPEQANGRPADARSDVYSLGVVLYELLAGDVPFHGGSFIEVAMQHLGAPVPPLAARCQGASPRLVAAVERALEKEPGLRFPTMDAFVAELQTCLEEQGDDAETAIIAAPPARKPPRRGRAPREQPAPVEVEPSARPRPRRRRRLAALVLLLALLALVGAGLAWKAGWLRSPSSPPPALDVPVHLDAVAVYNPGFGSQNDQELSLATDGNAATAWATECYATQHFGGEAKEGVGIVVAAASAVRMGSLTVASATPGYTALIKAGQSPGGPWQSVSSEQTGAASTRFALDVPSPERYYLVWITDLSPGRGPGCPARDTFETEINEVTAG